MNAVNVRGWRSLLRYAAAFLGLAGTATGLAQTVEEQRKELESRVACVRQALDAAAAQAGEREADRESLKRFAQWLNWPNWNNWNNWLNWFNR